MTKKVSVVCRNVNFIGAYNGHDTLVQMDVNPKRMGELVYTLWDSMGDEEFRSLLLAEGYRMVKIPNK